MASDRIHLTQICVVGGAGRVGLPLSVLLAEHLPSCRVVVVDADGAAIAKIRAGTAPFLEPALAERLAAASARNLVAATQLPTTDAHSVVVISLAGKAYGNGGPANPCRDFVAAEQNRLRGVAAVVFTGTLPPGQFAELAQVLAPGGRGPALAYCPERFAEGAALREMTELPQVVAADDAKGMAYARALFGALNPTLVETTVAEAEMIKLLTNAWRYLEFAAANQLFMLSHAYGVDYARVYSVMRQGYPRLQHLPVPGFAGGPCLPNDVRILLESPQPFPLGAAALAVNLGMPETIAAIAASQRPLAGATVAILGMAFKADSDDRRGSLSFALRDLLLERGARVLCSDEYVDDPDFVTVEQALAAADIVVIAVPHAAYRALQPRQAVIDPWGAVAAATPR